MNINYNRETISSLSSVVLHVPQSTLHSNLYVNIFSTKNIDYYDY